MEQGKIDIDLDADKQSLALQNSTNLQVLAEKRSSPIVKTVPAVKSRQVIDDERTIEAYIGAELYSQRMFPYGCPSFQKAQIKLLKKIDDEKIGSEAYKLIDSTYFDNKEGFGYMLKKIGKGNYQIQIRKYSFGFDVFDFTARIYSKNNIKLIDLEQEEIAR